MRVAIAIDHGVTDAGVAIALDVLRAAASLCRHRGRRAPFRIAVCSHDGRPVRAASGLRLGGLASHAAAARADALLVPGTWLESEAEVAAWLARPGFARSVGLVQRAHHRGATILASCTGTFVPGRAGLLDEREATTSWWLARAFARACPRVRLDAGRALIAHPRLVTAGAVFAMADLALHLVRTEVGPDIASQVMRHLLLDDHPAQAPYMALAQLVVDDPVLAAAERWVRARLATPCDVPTLARGIGTSPRTLARRVEDALGTSPARWLRRLRVEEAARLLETTTLPVEQVAERVGFGGVATLRREVQAQLGMAPRAVRARAQRRVSAPPPAPRTVGAARPGRRRRPA